MDNYRVTFMENNAVFNVVSKAALPEDVADELPKHVALERACMQNLPSQEYKAKNVCGSR